MTDGLILVKPKEDYTGMVFGKLTVIRRGPDLIYSNTRRAAWYCKCSCGNEQELLILGDSLKTGHTKSCGCATKDRHKNNNEYDLSGEYGRCIMNDGNVFIFDIEDFDKINKFKWHLSGREYVGTTIYDEIDGVRKHKTLMIHRLIMDVQDINWKECVVDHINGNVLDNRKSNLRIVSQSQNGMNSKKGNNNTSGVVGVSKIKDDKWIAYIRVNWEWIYLGVYNKFDDAVKARKDAEEIYFGEYSYKRSRQDDDR